MQLKRSTLCGLASMIAGAVGVTFLIQVVQPMESSARLAWTLWTVPTLGLLIFGLLAWGWIEQRRERAAD